MSPSTTMNSTGSPSSPSGLVRSRYHHPTHPATTISTVTSDERAPHGPLDDPRLTGAAPRPPAPRRPRPTRRAPTRPLAGRSRARRGSRVTAGALRASSHDCSMIAAATLSTRCRRSIAFSPASSMLRSADTVVRRSSCISTGTPDHGSQALAPRPTARFADGPWLPSMLSGRPTTITSASSSRAMRAISWRSC